MSPFLAEHDDHPGLNLLVEQRREISERASENAHPTQWAFASRTNGASTDTSRGKLWAPLRNWDSQGIQFQDVARALGARGCARPFGRSCAMPGIICMIWPMGPIFCRFWNCSYLTGAGWGCARRSSLVRVSHCPSCYPASVWF